MMKEQILTELAHNFERCYNKKSKENILNNRK